jgi:putative colanic acid biosynthesis acetyltransferase WcaF
MTQSKTSINSRNISPVTTGRKIKRLLWAFVERTFFRMSFHTWNRWRAMLLRMFGAKIGRKCIIRRTVRVYYPWNLTMGNLSTIGDRAELYNLGPVTIGSRVTISQLAYICAGTHDYTKASMPLLTPPITIEDDAWICALAFVGPGTVVGPGAVVAASSVVVKDVPPWKIVGGNPAKVIRDRDYDDRPDLTASPALPENAEAEKSR